MTIELYEGGLNLYLCIVNSKGGCLAARVFDVYDGTQRDGGSDIVAAAHELATYPDAWELWRVGMYPPGLAYEREILSTARLAAHYDSDGWHIDNPNCGSGVKKFRGAYNEAVAAGGWLDDCGDCRVSGLIDEEG